MFNRLEYERIKELETKIKFLAKHLNITFPEVEKECWQCDGRGKYDVSFHGSPTYETCEICNGKGKLT